MSTEFDSETLFLSQGEHRVEYPRFRQFRSIHAYRDNGTSIDLWFGDRQTHDERAALK
jgi:hypothetical protein